MRHLKILGSKKINAYCPASIKVVKAKDGKCTVYYQATHVGHLNDLGHLNLTELERKMLAEKIAANIPFDTILDEIRVSIMDCELERMHLLTKKDLHNIEKSFHLTSDAVKHSSDYVSVDLWVNEMRQTQNSPILFYKSQGVPSEYTFLSTSDFVLILMTNAQSEILKKFGPDSICLDSTHGVNAYGFELITLLVLDDLHQGFPCAFMFSNRCDQPVLSMFFALIKQHAGCIVPKVFMSDMAEAFYNAWKEVMGVPTMRLFCAWHVDHAWRKNLKK